MTEQVHRILCVDDELMLTEVLGLVVTELDVPFELLVAEHPDDVRRILAEDPVTMAMLDVNMPAINGITLAAEIAAGYPDVAVVVYSADGEKHRAAAEKAGATAYLTKPFDLDELLVVLRDRLQRRGQSLAS